MKPTTIDKHLDRLLNERLRQLRLGVSRATHPYAVENDGQYWRNLSDQEAFTKIALFVTGITCSNY